MTDIADTFPMNKDHSSDSAKVIYLRINREEFIDVIAKSEATPAYLTRGRRSNPVFCLRVKIHYSIGLGIFLFPVIFPSP
jgi:hypothetical protein